MTASTSDAVTPRKAGYRQPAEWEPHASCWLAWPSHEHLWESALGSVRGSFEALVMAIADPDPLSGTPRGESLDILVPDAANEALARRELEGLPCHFHRVPFGDIWLRDTAPIFVKRLETVSAAEVAAGVRTAPVAAVSFAFNGWGGKYVLPADDRVSQRIAALSGMRSFRFPWVLEGGSVETDGEGTCLTTRECLLNPNRNPGMAKEALEEGLKDALGMDEILWLDRGLVNDHTDGHVDTIARFVAPGVVVCMEGASADDPNRDRLAEILRDLSGFKDAAGRRLDVVRIPSPGRILDKEGRVMPASYVNFYIGNRTVVVPTYDSPSDDNAISRIARLFPGRRVLGLEANRLLHGGGAFHCISQQQPSA